ncbi:MAG: single-stranded DNA-binding protein [Treponemataceae bacterium]|nr:single-stranded DNA-binding protein [Treponemataceae bacterium]
MDLNRVTLVGRLTNDADLSYIKGSATAVSNFSIAVNRRRKSGEQWIDEVSFFNVTLFGKSAETLKSYLVKGKQVAVDGELRQDRWEKDGQKGSRVYIVANNVQLLGGRSDGGDSAEGYNAGGYQNRSYGNSGNGGTGRGSYQPRNEMPAPSYDSDPAFGGDSGFPDEIPF